MDEEVYHEKQHLLFCGVHAINNLFQNPCICSKEKLDDVCYSLNSSRWLNPHKSKFGLGNYDVNAIIAFLATLNYDVVWFDKRKYGSYIVKFILDQFVFVFVAFVILLLYPLIASPPY